MIDTMYVAVDIGCIECCEPSRLIGLFIDEAEALSACEEARAEQERNWTGQHEFEVYEALDYSGADGSRIPFSVLREAQDE